MKSADRDFKRVALGDAAVTRLLVWLIEGCVARGQQVVPNPSRG